MREVLEQLGSRPSRILSRCLICNTPLEEITPGEAAGSVPEYVLITQGEFRRCPTCERVFWPGTHLDDIRRVLALEGLLTSS